MIFKALILATFCVAASHQTNSSAFSSCLGLIEPANLCITNYNKGMWNFYKSSCIAATWQIQPKRYTSSLSTTVHLAVLFMGIIKSYDIAENQLYTSLSQGQSFPLEAGSVATVNFQMPVPDTAIPSIPFLTTVILHDQEGEIVSCFTVNSIVKTD